MGLVNVEIECFDMTRDHVIDMSRDFVREVLDGDITAGHLFFG